MAEINLQSIHDYLASLDPNRVMQDVSYSLDQNNQLGFDNSLQPIDFYVATPYGHWNNYPNSPPKPNPVASAVAKALFDGLLSPNVTVGPQGTKYVFVDFVNLSAYETDFWTADGDNGIFGTLRFLVNNLPHDVVPVIRLLSADSTMSKEVWTNGGDTKSWTSVLRNFWGSGNSNPITHPLAELYIGWYNPHFKKATTNLTDVNGGLDLPGWIDILIKRLEQFVEDEAEKDPLLKELEQFFPYLSELAQKAYNYVQANGLPTVSWNHAKMVVVNGTTVTTGGANYWNVYGDGATGIFDSAMKIQGDAAHAGHRYADAFWSYLNNIPGRDDQSVFWSRQLAIPAPTGPDQFSKTPTPLFGDMKQSTTNSGPVTVLTTNKVGDKLPTNYRYPLLTLDGIRDVIYQGMWLYLTQKQPALVGLWPKLASALSDTELVPLLASFKISPTVWASKAARLYAIENASSKIFIVQQQLVNPFLKGNPQGDELKNYLQSRWAISWDELVWPYDLMVSICKGLSRIVSVYVTDTESVYILLSTRDAPDGYGDLMSIADFKARLKIILLGLNVQNMLPVPLPRTDDSYVDKLLAERVQCKRIMNNDGRVMQHSKVVAVDMKIMYVGSDNAYPQYNDQHGIWIEEQNNVGAWKTEYFEKAWDLAVYAD